LKSLQFANRPCDARSNILNIKLNNLVTRASPDVLDIYNGLYGTGGRNV